MTGEINRQLQSQNSDQFFAVHFTGFFETERAIHLTGNCIIGFI